jgi:cytoskeletal protein CcmA (bactofilin family)
MKLKNVLAYFGLAILVFVLGAPAQAAELLGPKQNDQNVVLGAKESKKNLYVAGPNVTINGEVVGDLTAAGGMVTITGKTENQALIAGGTLSLNGPIGSTARVAGGNITISAPIGGDLVVAGGTVNLTGSASVAGDLLVAGGNVIIDAPVSGSIRAVGGSILINSKVGGQVWVKNSQNLNFGPSAEVSGKIEYSGYNKAVTDPGAKISAITFTQLEKKNFKNEVRGLMTVAFLIKLLAWLLAGLVLVKLFKNSLVKFLEEYRAKPWENFGYGLLFSLFTPVLAVVLLITFVGYYLAMLVGAVYFLAVLIGSVAAAVALGYYLLSMMNKPGEAPKDWQAVLLGVVAWMILAWIPVLGWLVMMVLWMMTFGVIAKMVKASLK